MMRVRCILVETTVPVRIRPRIETMPVKGHFLSAEKNSSQLQFLDPIPPPPLAESSIVGKASCVFEIRSGRFGRLGARVLVRYVPMYWPSMAVLGVRKPRPTSLYHLRPPLPGRADLTLVVLLRKTMGSSSSVSASSPTPCCSRTQLSRGKTHYAAASGKHARSGRSVR